MSSRLKAAAALLAALFAASCENPWEKAKADAKKYPPIAAARTVGTPCFETDSASVQRVPRHPLGPTGGWHGKTAILDPARTSDTAAGTFREFAGEFVGYVKFDTEGVLKIRSYDNVYGTVYCGWSPNTVAYTPQAKAVYLRMGSCGVGDGGLAQETEICWFPKGEKEGRIVYTTAHREKRSGDEHLYYSPEHIGTLSERNGKKIYYYQDFQARGIFRSLLTSGKSEEAHELVLATLPNFEYMAGAIEGSSRKPIPPKEFHAAEWKSLLFMKAGFELFEPSGIEAIEEAQKILTGAKFCFDCDYAKELVQYYRWAVLAVQGKKPELPLPSPDSKHVHGYDPAFVHKVLSDPSLTEATLKKFDFSLGGESTYFWLGLRSYLTGNMPAAEADLRKFLTKPNNGQIEFEASAALTILEKIGAGSPK